MFIIIEGADKTGKTTLSNAIIEKFGSKYVHFGKPKKHPATEYAEYALENNGNLVLDRFYLGELVYGPLLRGKAGIDDVEFATIERILRKKQAILIQTTTNSALANKRLLVSTQDEAVNTTQNKLAAEGFRLVGATSNIQHHILYDGSTYENLAELLEKLAVLRAIVEPNQAKINKVCTGIGTPVGRKIVFVGEAVNKKVTWLNLPFDRGFSSKFLLDSFKAAGVPENKVYLCNADKLKKAEVDFLRNDPTVFVALGKKAEAKLKELNVSCYALPHPQWVKRFHWQTKDEYAKDIKSILVNNNDIL
jgi:hypothetical protein